MMKFVPSLEYASNSPFLGKIVNSASDSGVKYALNYACCLLMFVSLNETLVVLWIPELIVIISSSFGSIASKNNLYLFEKIKIRKNFLITSNNHLIIWKL